MRIYELFHKLVEKFVPMDILTQNELSGEAANKYGAINIARLSTEKMNDAIKKENDLHRDDPDYIPAPPVPLKIDQKIVGVLEQWWFRYLCALAFIFLVPKIKSYINGDSSRGSVDDGEDDDDEYEDYKEFLRYKKSMR